jgi:branched-chain amino acid transport system ATP-binding protein
LLLNPRVLLLDEPSQGLAPLVVQDVFRVVASMRESGISVLLVEQNVRAAVAIADRAYVLETGRMVISGTASELAGNAAVSEAFLGGGTRPPHHAN